MEQLAARHCVPCEGGTPPLSATRTKELLADLNSAWTLGDNRIRREFRFKDFTSAMVFVNHVATIAEAEGHHPDIHISYNRVIVELWTHAVGGLSENDFIVAAKIDKVTSNE